MNRFELWLTFLMACETLIICMVIRVFFGPGGSSKIRSLVQPSAQEHVLRLKWVTSQPRTSDPVPPPATPALTSQELKWMRQYEAGGLRIIECGPNGERRVMKDGKTEYVFYS